MLVHVIDEEKGGYRPAERAERIYVRPFPIKIHLLISVVRTSKRRLRRNWVGWMEGQRGLSQEISQLVVAILVGSPGRTRGRGTS